MELFLGNTFAWCVFGSFAGYYFAFASVLTPSFGIAAAYSDPAELNNGLGVFFCVWASLFFIFLGASVRTNLIFVWIFTLVDVTAWLLAASYFQAAAGNTAAAVRLQKVGNSRLWPSGRQDTDGVYRPAAASYLPVPWVVGIF
jgi:succinate-acetate transporter protein